ncbi:hypothetical protein F4778DRAFT_778614 [Xylariomycetidae sp. FL2044]|nr:hypothetical protein F4778DRAFT_778614 [Xylariomycetidae sp. FL2044]
MEGLLLWARAVEQGAVGANEEKKFAKTPIAGFFDFYHLNVILSGACAAFSTVVILLLMRRHATHMSRPKERIQHTRLSILRICWFISVFAIGMWIMILVPRTYVYLLSFLILSEPADSSPSPSSGSSSSGSSSTTPKRGEIFLSPLVAHCRRTNWALADESTFFRPYSRFRRHWFEVFQLPRRHGAPHGRERRHPGHGHIVSMVAAVIGVVHAYVPLRRELREHRALSKFWAFKLLIFLQVAQGLAFSILDGIKPLSLADSEYLSSVDILVDRSVVRVSQPRHQVY